jgi:hypothetical protein
MWSEFSRKDETMRSRTRITGWLFNSVIPAVLAIFFSGTIIAAAQEHPGEHPSEHPTSEKASITKESLAAAITDYVNKESDLKGGYFLFFDKQQNKPLALALDKVHKDRLATLGDGVYFACADFKDTGGDMYDLDIFMKDGTSGLEVSDISVHKKNGEARYDWVEKDGIWSKKKM